MEQLVIALVLAGLDAIPKVIAAVQASQNLTAEEKARVLLDLHARLDAAKTKVAGVKFRDPSPG